MDDARLEFARRDEVSQALDKGIIAINAEMQRVTDRTGEALGEMAETLRLLSNASMASTMVCAIISKICIERFGIDPNGLSAAVAEQTDDPEVLKLARDMLGGRPALMLIKGGLTDDDGK